MIRSWSSRNNLLVCLKSSCRKQLKPTRVCAPGKSTKQLQKSKVKKFPILSFSRLYLTKCPIATTPGVFATTRKHSSFYRFVERSILVKVTFRHSLRRHRQVQCSIKYNLLFPAKFPSPSFPNSSHVSLDTRGH